MEFIRPALATDASRIAEIIITNYRVNFYPFFRNDSFYFGELNVMDMATEYAEGTDALRSTYVYDDGVVKGIIRISGNEIEKLYIEPQFQSQGIGARLLDFAVNEKKASWLWVLEYNTRGISFYHKHGFLLTGEKIIEDEWVPLLKMSKAQEIQLRIITQNSPDKARLEAINEEAFPVNERNSIDDLFASGGDGNLDIIGIYTDDELSGFFAVRKFGRIRYMAYFAVCSEKRSMGIGSKALHLLKDFYPCCQIINEFEAPDEMDENNAVRLRRRDFYLRNGFCETGWYSFYDDTEFVIACSDAQFDIAEFQKFIVYLNSIVPDHIPKPYQKNII
ncbi:MAG: GNAT family N-acetyltransferase [Ruminococcus sp.]|nr:GNAT family N-acetyltransferase [Ruminococcus sp.]